MTEDWTKDTGAVTNLEERSVSRDIVLANYALEDGDCPNGAQQRTLIILRQRYFLDSFSALYSFGFLQVDGDTRGAIVHEVVQIAPADQSFGIDFAIRPGDKGRAP